MKLRRTLLIVAAVCAVAFGSITLGLTRRASTGVNASSEQTLTVTSKVSCGKCGDGICLRQCGENEGSCPRDCGGVPIIKTSETFSQAR
jgi:hypothetical protein